MTLDALTAMLSGMTKYLLAVPYFGGLDPEHLRGIRALQHQGVELLSVHNVPYIDHARSMLASKALRERDAEVVMWVDHDIIFFPEQVEPMVDRLLDSDYAMLGAAYSQKRPQGSIVGCLTDPRQQVTFYEPGIHEADGVGFGFTAVKRTAFEAVAETLFPVYSGVAHEKIWPFFHHIIDGEFYYGEDYSFCKRVRDCGLRVGMDVEPRVWHKGSYCYSLEDLAMVVPNLAALKSDFSDQEHGPHLLEPSKVPEGAKT